MAQFTLSLTHGTAGNYKARTTDEGTVALPKVLNFLNGIAGHTYRGTAFTVATTQASGTLTFEGGSGTVGGSINGVSFTFTATGDDEDDGVAFAALVTASANALISGVVTASADTSGQVTITAVDAGKTGNAITLAASGTGVTASGARLTGGASTSYTL